MFTIVYIVWPLYFKTHFLLRSFARTAQSWALTLLRRHHHLSLALTPSHFKYQWASCIRCSLIYLTFATVKPRNFWTHLGYASALSSDALLSRPWCHRPLSVTTLMGSCAFSSISSGASKLSCSWLGGLCSWSGILKRVWEAMGFWTLSLLDFVNWSLVAAAFASTCLKVPVFARTCLPRAYF